MKDNETHDQHPEMYTKVVKAGKRTYYIDIKATKGNDHYITITESKKQNEQFQKHKIFIYKEDFEKIKEAFIEVIDKANSLNQQEVNTSQNTSTLEFEDLE